MNKTTLFIMSGTILLTSTYALAQTRPHNNPIQETIPQVTIPSPRVTVPTPQVTIPTPEVAVPAPPVIEVPTGSTPSLLPDQSVVEQNGGPQYKNKQNKGKSKAKGKNKHNKGKHKGKNKGKHKGEGKGKGKGKHKGKYRGQDGN